MLWPKKTRNWHFNGPSGKTADGTYVKAQRQISFEYRLSTTPWRSGTVEAATTLSRRDVKT